MKFTTILFNLAVVATITNGVHGKSDDMDNTTDTTAAVAASSDSEEGEGGGFIANMKKGWSQFTNGLECYDDVVDVFTANPDLMAAFEAWDKSGTKTIVGNEETSNSFTWAYDMDLCKAFMKECEKVDGMIFTPIDDETYECEYYGIGNGDGKPTVATSGNGVCLKDSESCNALEGGPVAAADGEMYEDLQSTGGFICKSLVSVSGASTNFLGSSVVVAATAVVAVTVLLI
mmetsp:Transcript_9815/g.10569  ORF Transcript_9815/g.10569 Transcript_9815/m.10569 type:complete len:231 (+) Transcript_9815:136-828(+)